MTPDVKYLWPAAAGAEGALGNELTIAAASLPCTNTPVRFLLRSAWRNSCEVLRFLLDARAHAAEEAWRMAALAWAAGLADGEGCFHIARQIYGDPRRRNRPTYVFRLTVAQSDHFVLQRFLRVLGVHGLIHARRWEPSMNRQPYVLCYSGRHAFDVVRLLYPHLVAKRTHAQVALAFERDGRVYEHRGPGGQDPAVWVVREWYYRKMRRMN